ACELTEPLRPGVVHPELALEVDLAGCVAPFLEERDRRLGAVPRGHAGGAIVQQRGHIPSVLDCPRVSVGAGETSRFPQTSSPVRSADGPLRGRRPTPSLPSTHGQEAVTYRFARARHRSPADRPLA